MEETNPKFYFWTPVEIEKAGGVENEIDHENMFIKGIASTEDVDLDNQIMKSDGFNIDYLLSRGFLNWHHQSKNNPSAIIGEPVEAKIIDKPKKGLFIKAKLYNTPTAVEAYELANLLEKQSKNRRLGFSIEGKVVEKKGEIITKAKLTGVALTHAPKNKHTFAEVCKAMVDGSTTEELLSDARNMSNNKIVIETNSGIFSFNNEGNLHFVEKALEADGGGSVLKRESLEGGLKLLKPNLSVVLNKVFKKYPDITFEKALNVAYKVIEKRSKNN